MKKTLIGFIILMMFGLQISSYAVEIESAGVDIHGFVSQGFLKSTNYNYLANDSNKGSFQYNELGINFSKQVTENLRIGAQFFSRDIGDAANNKITIDWAYGDYWFAEWLGVRAGKIKMPFGLYNETRDMDMLRACIVLPQGIYDDLIRDTMIASNGASLYGTIPMWKAGSLEYQVLVGVANVDADSGFSKASSTLPGMTIADFNSPTYIGSLRWNTPLSGLALKGTLFRADADETASIGPYSFLLEMKAEDSTLTQSAIFVGTDCPGAAATF